MDKRDIPRRSALPLPPTDFGNSSDNNRRCKTCACYLEIVNPNDPRQVQGLCRRNCVNMVLNQVQGIAGPRQEMSLTFAPTQADLVCFDGWRPISTAPGASFKQDAMVKAFVPIMESALKQAGVSAKLSENLGRAMADHVIAAGSISGGDEVDT